MSITRHHSGRWMYQFDSVIAGRRHRANKLLPKGWTRAQAKDYDQRETARLWELASGGKPEEPLIEDAVLLYLQDHGPSGKHPRKNHEDVQAALALLHPFYAGRRMNELGAIVDEYFKDAERQPREGQKGTPGKLAVATIRNRLAYLRMACRYHWKVNKKAYTNPADHMDLPSVNNARHVYLNRRQVVHVLRRMGEIERRKARQMKERDVYVARMAVRVAFYSGWRIGQVLAADVLERDGILFLSAVGENTKNGEPHITPAHPRIAQILRDHWPLNITKWTVSKKWKAALREEGLGHARLHDARHSAASEMINAKIDLFTVGKVLGHKSLASSARYAHLVAQTLGEAVNKIGARSAKKSQPGRAKKAA